MVKHFKEEFKNRYGKTQMPAFETDTLRNILIEAMMCPVRQVRDICIMGISYGKKKALD